MLSKKNNLKLHIYYSVTILNLLSNPAVQITHVEEKQETETFSKYTAEASKFKGESTAFYKR